MQVIDKRLHVLPWKSPQCLPTITLVNIGHVMESLSALVAGDDRRVPKLGPTTVKTVRIAMYWFIPANSQRISSTFVSTVKQCGIHPIRVWDYNAKIAVHQHSFFLEIRIIHKIKTLLKHTSHELAKQVASRIPTANMTKRYVKSAELLDNLVATL